MTSRISTVGRCLLAVAILALLVYLGLEVVTVNATTIALAMLMVILGVSTFWALPEAIFTSLAAVLLLNYFFLPPVRTFTIAEPENWIALAAFLATSITVSQLSATAKRRADEAIARGNELTRLYDLSRSLLMDEARDPLRGAVIRTGRILELDCIAFFERETERLYGSLAGSGATEADLREVARTGNATPGIVPVRLGSQLLGSLALGNSKLSDSVRESVANLLAINYERVRALDRAALAEVARRTEEFRSSLLDGLAHDLKTPLTAIRTCITRLIAIPPKTEDVRQELLSIIDHESARLQQTISETIQLARLESQELRLNRELIGVETLLRSAVAETRDERPERYRFTIPGEPAIEVDVDLARRALLQILENARKYAPPDSPVDLEVSLREDRLAIAVSDRGPGIPAEELTRIFEKFYRGSAGTAKVEGTGMGLAIARSIVEAHGGEIRALNRPGGGATILIELPATP